MAERKLGHAALQDAARLAIGFDTHGLRLQRDQPVGHAIGLLELGIQGVDGLDVLASELEGALLLEVNARRDQHVSKDQVRERRAVAEAHRGQLASRRQRVHVVLDFSCRETQHSTADAG